MTDEDDPFGDVNTESDDATADDAATEEDDADRTTDFQKWEDRLDQREEGLDQRAERLKERTAELDDREADLEAQQQNLEEWASELEDRQKRLEQREAELDDREEAIRERENELDARAADLDEKEQVLHQYVGHNLGDLESSITDAVSSSVERIEPGQAEVDQASVETAIDSAMDDYRKGRFGVPGNVVFGLLGIALVAGGVSAVFLAEASSLTPLFADDLANYGAAVALAIVGLAINLSAAAGRL